MEKGENSLWIWSWKGLIRAKKGVLTINHGDKIERIFHPRACVAVGGKKFVVRIKKEFGFRAIGRKFHGGLQAGTNVLRVPGVSYSIDPGIKMTIKAMKTGCVWIFS